MLPLWKEFAAEFVGTFVFLFIVLTQAQPIPIAVGLLASIYAFGQISGGQFNPAVTFMVKLKDSRFTWGMVFVYVSAQLLAATAAYETYSRTSQRARLV
jgi:aquaporin Z